MVENVIKEYKRAYYISRRLEEKLLEISDLPGHSLSVWSSGGGRSDLTASRAMSREELERKILEAKRNEVAAKKIMEQELQAVGNENLRKIIICRFFRDWSWVEIARRLGMKVSTVKMQWRRFHEKECHMEALISGGKT